jgi:hypothetical protein
VVDRHKVWGPKSLVVRLAEKDWVWSLFRGGYVLALGDTWHARMLHALAAQVKQLPCFLCSQLGCLAVLLLCCCWSCSLVLLGACLGWLMP